MKNLCKIMLHYLYTTRLLHLRSVSRAKVTETERGDNLKLINIK